MDITISKKQAEILPCLFREPFGRNRSNLNYSSGFEFNLYNYDKEALVQLKSEVDANLSTRGMKSLSKDLEAWISFNEDQNFLKQKKMTNVKKAVYVFFFRMIGMERKHLYRRNDDGDDTRWLVYYVEDISYHGKTKWTEEHLTFSLRYIKRGKVKSASFAMGKYTVLGNTPDAALIDCGYRFENAVLRDNYEDELEYYNSFVEDVGKQFWATGTASTDGVDSDSDSYWGRFEQYEMDKDDEPSQVVIDVERETDKSTEKSGSRKETNDFWSKRSEFFRKRNENEEDEDVEQEAIPEDEDEEIPYPFHPYVTIFHLKKHIRLSIHISNLKEYVYDENIRERLVIPSEHQKIIDCLLNKSTVEFTDTVKNKAGGIIILSQGPPGTGKTLTAEIYAEVLKRPLYTIQCSQLGIHMDDLEKNLVRVLERGKRWNAVTLLDEADVYVHQRGNDLVQNAIVGVFLRVLEYQSGVLFLTTNRGDLVDDAVLSRCTVRIPYDVPTIENQKKIWKTLAKANQIELTDEQVENITDFHNDLSGRDIKNLLKLLLLVHSDPAEINDETVSDMRVFKATTKAKNV